MLCTFDWFKGIVFFCNADKVIILLYRTMSKFTFFICVCDARCTIFNTYLALSLDGNFNSFNARLNISRHKDTLHHLEIHIVCYRQKLCINDFFIDFLWLEDDV